MMQGYPDEVENDEEDSDTDEGASAEVSPSRNEHEGTGLEQAVNSLSSGGSAEDLTYVPNSGTSSTNRYPDRVRKGPDRLAYTSMAQGADATSTADIDDSPTLHDVFNGEDALQWKQAIAEEIESLVGNRTRVTVKRSSATSRPLDTKVVLKIKRNTDGTVQKYKARLVIKGYQQHLQQGIYTLVVDVSSIRLLI